MRRFDLQYVRCLGLALTVLVGILLTARDDGRAQTKSPSSTSIRLGHDLERDRIRGQLAASRGSRAGRLSASSSDSLSPVGPGRFAWETIAGVGSGLLGAAAGALTGLAIGYLTLSGSTDEGETGGAVVGGVTGHFSLYAGIGSLIGYGGGVPLGTYQVGTTEQQTGSFMATLGGSVAGLAVAGTIGQFADVTDEQNDVQGWYSALVLFGPPLLAATGFNLTREARPAGEPRAALEYHDGRLRAHLPRPAVRVTPVPRAKILIVPLARVHL